MLSGSDTPSHPNTVWANSSSHACPHTQASLDCLARLVWAPERAPGGAQFWSSDDQIPLGCRQQLTHLWSQVDKELRRYVPAHVYVSEQMHRDYHPPFHVIYSAAPRTHTRTEFAGSWQCMASRLGKCSLWGGKYAPIQMCPIPSVRAAVNLGAQKALLSDSTRATARTTKQRRRLRPKSCMCVAI